MKIRSLLGVALVVVTVLPRDIRGQGLDSGARRRQEVGTLVRTEMQGRQIPGMQVVVVQHGKIVMKAAYGLADVEHSIPVTNQTLFSVASMTKAFTGVAIMQLVEEGKLRLDASVSEYVEGLPMAWRAVTVAQLLTHESGIPDIVDQRKGKLVGDGSPESFISKANTLPMEFAPGERFSYNQTNYLLLGKIIEKLSGETYRQFVTDGQLVVAGMRGARFGGFSDIVKDRAQPYDLQRIDLQRMDRKGVGKERLINIFYESVPALDPANGIDSSAEEIADWVIALQQGRLLKDRKSIDTMWTPGVLRDGERGGFGGPLNGYALGWPVMSRATHRAMAPIGGNWAALFVYPDDDLSVVVLTNLQGSHPEMFVDDIAACFVPDIRNAVGFGIPRAIKTLQAEIAKRGFEHAIEIVSDPKNKEWKAKLREADVNALGYRLLGGGEQKQALEIFKLNAALFPGSANVYDSLADGYEGVGERGLAIASYKRSLQLNPQNENAASRVKALEAEGAKP